MVAVVLDCDVGREVMNQSCASRETISFDLVWLGWDFLLIWMGWEFWCFSALVFHEATLCTHTHIYTLGSESRREGEGVGMWQQYQGVVACVNCVSRQE